MTIRPLLFVLALMCFGQSMSAQTIIKPEANIAETSFAVITDTPTWKACSKEIGHFASQLGKEALPTFIVHANWKSPEQVKKVILKLYKKHSLEGVIFVGDIPVVMVRRGQHLTSAFKMDEDVYPLIESSVPSDRFYDDFDLKFDYICEDSVRGGYFYYNLAVDSPRQIKCDIYSARVKPISNGESSADQIKRFFGKAVLEHLSDNKLDQFYSHTGDGSYSNSLNAWATEASTIREQMPGTFDSPIAPGRARFTRYNFSDYPKDDIIKQLVREDLDLTVFHEHGIPERQYISAIPSSRDMDSHIALYRESLRSQARNASGDSAKMAAFEARNCDLGLDLSWWGDYNATSVIKADSAMDARRGILLDDITDFKPNSRVVIFDACYNGDFREDDCIASRYIFADGKTVSTFANSVNVLQDKQADDMLGLLWLGARVGQWAREINVLESHIIGDPTFRFSSYDSEVDASELCRRPYDEANERALLHSPYTDVRNLAMHRLWRGGADGFSRLLAEIFRSSPVSMERYTALSLLEKINDSEYNNILPVAIADANEFIRRTAISCMGRVGRDEYVRHLVDVYFEDTQAERVIFQIENNIYAFGEVAFENAIAGYSGARADRLRKAFERQKNADKSILSKDESAARWRKLYIKSLRNNNIHASLSSYIAIIEDPAEPEDIRLALLDALAWYTESYRKNEILSACERILLHSSETSKSVREQALRTYYRLK